MTAKQGLFMKVAIGLTLLLMLIRAWTYHFLTDDAYIAFRYARNLSHGHGLVFNPGLERVEGYTNFLWVLVLAGLDRAGLAPEQTANALSLLLTVVLWALIVRHLWRESAEPWNDWAILVPLALLMCRSFAMWSTSGLETRAFELLVVAGVLRLSRELDTPAGVRTAPWAAVFLGLASLTRPDGILVACVAFGAGALMEWGAGRFQLGAMFRRAWPFAALVCAHLSFRLAYYGEWVPNTYFAKVGGRLMWKWGLMYLGAFVLEYSLWLWIPLVLAAVARAFRHRRPILPVICLAVILVHTAYVVAIGGDHFEYRPLNLWFPLLALILADGVRKLVEITRSRAVAGIYVVLALVGLFWIPRASRAQFPHQYMPGFPGARETTPEAISFLDPARDPLLKLTPFNCVARAHRKLVQKLTRHFIAIRQEEHRMFLANAETEAYRIRGLLDRRMLPGDVFLAMSSVGIIPYISDAATLDRVGLTDATVAHSEFSIDLMAHGKMATMDYARERGVDLWFEDPVYLHQDLLSTRLIKAVAAAHHSNECVWAAEVSSNTFLVCRLPQGPESAVRRMPLLKFRSVADPAFASEYFSRAVSAQEREMGTRRDFDNVFKMASLFLYSGKFAEAAVMYREALLSRPGDLNSLGHLAECQFRIGDRSQAAQTITRMFGEAARTGRARDAGVLIKHLRALEHAIDEAGALPPPSPDDD